MMHGMPSIGLGCQSVVLLSKGFSSLHPLSQLLYIPTDSLFHLTDRSTQNAFIEQLGPNFNLSQMLVVDVMHELELGIWKSIFVHLIRMLYAAAPGGKLVGILDERYVKCSIHVYIIAYNRLGRFRQVPAFGRTIRRFRDNASEIKKLAA
jgi:hypothetical protein